MAGKTAYEVSENNYDEVLKSLGADAQNDVIALPKSKFSLKETDGAFIVSKIAASQSGDHNIVSAESLAMKNEMAALKSQFSEISNFLAANDMAVWDTAFINTLPDSSFAFIMPGGSKDAEGKTVPRNLRKLPYKDASGKVDASHVRNALARLPQTDGIPAGEVSAIQKKLETALASLKSMAFSDEPPTQEQNPAQAPPAQPPAPVPPVVPPTPPVQAPPAAQPIQPPANAAPAAAPAPGPQPDPAKVNAEFEARVQAEVNARLAAQAAQPPAAPPAPKPDPKDIPQGKGAAAIIAKFNPEVRAKLGIGGQD